MKATGQLLRCKFIADARMQKTMVGESLYPRILSAMAHKIGGCILDRYCTHMEALGAEIQPRYPGDLLCYGVEYSLSLYVFTPEELEKYTNQQIEEYLRENSIYPAKSDQTCKGGCLE